MKHFILLSFFSIITFPAFAGDKNLTCEEIAAEIEELAAIETAAGGAAVANTVTGAAGAAATQGAILSGAGSSIPFIGGIANIASAVSSQNEANAKKEAAKAEKRMIKLETIADMKGC